MTRVDYILFYIGIQGTPILGTYGRGWSSMDKIVNTLKRHFRPQEALPRIMSEFFRFHQGKLTLKTYAREVEAIGGRAELGSEEESLVRNKLIDGLESERTFKRLCDIIPETMKEAVIRAHEMEHTASQKTEKNNRAMEMPKKLKTFGLDIVGTTEVVEEIK